MDFLSVFRERVLRALGNRRCTRMFLFLFPVPIKIPPPLLPSVCVLLCFLLFFNSRVFIKD